MKKRVLISVLLLLLAVLLAIPAAADSSEEPVIFDQGEFLYQSTEAELSALAREKANETGCHFYVVTHDMRGGVGEYWGEDFLADQGLSKNDDIVLLIITRDYSEYYYDLYLYGDARDLIDRHEIDYILDHEDVYQKLKGGHLAQGIEAFLDLSAENYLGRSPECEAIVKAYYLKLFLISLVIALVIGTVACVSVYKSYGTKKKSVDYPLEHFAKMDLKHQEDIFMGSFVTTRIIRTNNGSGGGGGGGRGGGGGHAGGR